MSFRLLWEGTGARDFTNLHR